MGLAANIRRDIKFAGGLFRLLKRIKPITLDSDVLACDDIEEAVDRFGPNIAVEDETRKLTYEATANLLSRHDDLIGLYCAGGGAIDRHFGSAKHHQFRRMGCIGEGDASAF